MIPKNVLPKATIVLAAAVPVVLGQNAQPNTPATATRLPEVTVVGTLDERPNVEVPSSTARVEAPKLEMSRSMPDALEDVPGVMIQKTSRGQGSPYIRGFTGFRNVLLIDGIRLNNSVFREGPNQYWNTVDPLSLERLELVKGPSSVLYGSDAIGGAVNAITKSRQEFGSGFNWNPGAHYRVSSAERSHIGRGELSGNVDEKLGFLVGGGYKHFGDIQGGHAVQRQRRTSYDEYNWDAKLQYLLDPNAELVFAHQTVDQNDIWRTHSTIYGISWEGTTVGSDLQRSFDQHRELTYLQYHRQNMEGFINEVHFSLSHHLQEEDEFRIRNTGRRDLAGFEVNTLGTFLHLHSDTPAGKFIYGVDYYRDWVDSMSKNLTAGTRAVQGPVGDDATYDLIGVFVTDTISFGDKFDLIPGVRYTAALVDIEKTTIGAIEDDYNSLDGSLRGIYHLDPERHWNIFAGVSQGFRAPNLSDLSRSDSARTNEREIPSPNLDPERFVSLEGGLKVDFDQVTVQASYYHTFIRDMIVRTPTGVITGAGEVEVTKLNSGDGYVHGVELSSEYHFHPQWTALGRFSYTEGEVDAFPSIAAADPRREPISRMMPITGQFGLRWDSIDWPISVEALYTGVDEQDRVNSGDASDTQRFPPGGTPGYHTIDLALNWHVTEKVDVRAAVENITDEDYRIHGSGVNEPGRNFILSLNARF